MDERLNTLSRWTGHLIGSPVDLRPASSDASFRRYFRVFCPAGHTYIAMDAPPEHESVGVFARTAARFRDLRLNVPLVFGLDKIRGFALLSDLGERTYLDAVRDDDVDTLYDDALRALWRLQRGSTGRLDIFKPYDRDELTREMELFREWFIPYRTSHRLSPGDNAVIERTYDLLVTSALEQPRVWVHRDYHSRNLMITPAENPGILDFQDAVAGPVTYDLVSLLRDCYITWPPERVRAWLTRHYERINTTVLSGHVSEEQFTQWFDWMGVQRHVKVLGIFARLYHRDGKASYLNDLPVVYRYVVDVCGQYRELRPFKQLLESMEITWTS